MSDTEDIHQLASRIRELGGVVAVFTPEEVERVPDEDRHRIEDAMVEHGGMVIDLLEDR